MANHYVSQNGAGTQDGSSAANARAVTWLNNSANWGGSGIVAGDFVRLVDTISSAITVYGSGTAGNVITILFETGAKLSAAGLNGDWITITTRDYITIDGGATGTIGGPNANLAGVNGIIENTDNGSGLGSQVSTRGVFARGCRHLTVKNLAIKNLYVRTSNTDLVGGGTAIWMDDDNNRGINDHLITNLHIHDTQVGVAWEYGPSSADFTMSYVTVTRANFGGRCGGSGAGVSGTRLTVAHCRLYDWRNWDTPSPPSDVFHHDGFFLWALSSANWAVADFYGNQIGPDYTTQYDGYNSATAGIFTKGRVAGPVQVYNNLFPNNGQGAPSDGIIKFITQEITNAVFRVMNNTFIGGTGANQVSFDSEFSGAHTTLIQNNIFTGADYAIVSLLNSGATLTSNHNLGHSLVADPFKWSSTGSGGGISLASWQAIGSNHDPDWVTSDPLLSGAYRLGAGSLAIGAGENLSAYFTTDAAGETRPSSAAWDLGAYLYASLSPSPIKKSRGRVKLSVHGS